MTSGLLFSKRNCRRDCSEMSSQLTVRRISPPQLSLVQMIGSNVLLA